MTVAYVVVRVVQRRSSTDAMYFCISMIVFYVSTLAKGAAADDISSYSTYQYNKATFQLTFVYLSAGFF